MEEMWEVQGIPEVHRVEFKHRLEGCTPTQREDLIHKEIADLLRGGEPIQVLMEAVKRREELITQLYDLETKVGEAGHEALQKETAVVLENIRNLSLAVIENLLSWRLRLSKPAVFLYHNQNYLIKMKTDLNFLQNSSLSGYFFFSETGSDPFLLHTAGPRTFSRM